MIDSISGLSVKLQAVKIFATVCPAKAEALALETFQNMVP